ncbi:MAG: prepilin-type N-terminal cleavage/methylation domain-containing protein [Candidatus Omnitrophica bacterium]|nr:prepilin-type N-terminal cleavage/methylation domain-containing protein [Candidatus Omnitrophota bacterium]
MFKRSFTLIELIVVIAIIAILAAIIAPNAFQAIEKAKIIEAIGDFKTLKTAIYALYADTGHWMTDHHTRSYIYLGDNPNRSWYNTHDLIEDNNSYTGWDGPYLEKVKGKTPWKGSYAVCGGCSWGVFSNKNIALEFEDVCYNPADGGNGACPMPSSSRDRIDEKVDDGDRSSGDFRGGSDVHWILVKDVYDF